MQYLLTCIMIIGLMTACTQKQAKSTDDEPSKPPIAQTEPTDDEPSKPPIATNEPLQPEGIADPSCPPALKEREAAPIGHIWMQIGVNPPNPVDGHQSKPPDTEQADIRLLIEPNQFGGRTLSIESGSHVNGRTLRLVRPELLASSKDESHGNTTLEQWFTNNQNTNCELGGTQCRFDIVLDPDGMIIRIVAYPNGLTTKIELELVLAHNLCNESEFFDRAMEYVDARQNHMRMRHVTPTHLSEHRQFVGTDGRFATAIFGSEVEPLFVSALYNEPCTSPHWLVGQHETVRIDFSDSAERLHHQIEVWDGILHPRVGGGRYSMQFAAMNDRETAWGIAWLQWNDEFQDYILDPNITKCLSMEHRRNEGDEPTVEQCYIEASLWRDRWHFWILRSPRDIGPDRTCALISGTMLDHTSILGNHLITTSRAPGPHEENVSCDTYSSQNWEASQSYDVRTCTLTRATVQSFRTDDFGSISVTRIPHTD